MSNYYITPDQYEIGIKNGIARKRIYDRVYVDGWSVRRAITEPVRKETDRSKWAKVAKENGISYQGFIQRVNRMGWSEKKAATTPLMTMKEVGKRVVEKKNQQYGQEIIDIAEKNGISRQMLFRRIQKSGWSVEDAATIKPMTKSEAARSRRRKYEFTS